MSAIFTDLRQIISVGSLAILLLAALAVGGASLVLAGAASLSCAHSACADVFAE
ncbi:MAG TPA: hypothetical protein VK446_02210 [Methylocystis sp.]|nr:hypothetical protein [Methylocystis sp.]